MYLQLYFFKKPVAEGQTRINVTYIRRYDVSTTIAADKYQMANSILHCYFHAL